MKSKTITICLLIALLYAWTWYGGYVSHSERLRDKANKAYLSYCEEYKRQSDYLKENDIKASENLYKVVHKNGARTGVDWCFPILPGVLLANSYYSIGPLWGAGGIKVVLFYGVGTIDSFPIFGWIS